MNIVSRTNISLLINALRKALYNRMDDYVSAKTAAKGAAGRVRNQGGTKL